MPERLICTGPSSGCPVVISPRPPRLTEELSLHGPYRPRPGTDPGHARSIPTAASIRRSLRRLVEFELAAGVDGVAVFGMASEGFALTAAERRTILADVVEVVDGRVPVVAGVNGTSTATAIEQALHRRRRAAPTRSWCCRRSW